MLKRVTRGESSSKKSQMDKRHKSPAISVPPPLISNMMAIPSSSRSTMSSGFAGFSDDERLQSTDGDADDERDEIDINSLPSYQ